ncbi:MAG: hypothetical protein ACRCRV_05255, partial [Cetobacterium sp.]
ENENIDIYIANRSEYTFDFKFLKKKYWLNEKIEDYKFNIRNKNKTLNYFKNSNSIGAMYSYLSSIIVKKSKWNSIKYDESYTGTAYSHAYILLKILLNNGTQKYIKQSLVKCRGGNDTFLKSIKQRFFLDYNGYLKLSEEIKDENLKIEFNKILTREHPLKHLLIMVLNEKISDSENKILKKIGYEKYKLFIMFIINKMNPLPIFIYQKYRQLRRKKC